MGWVEGVFENLHHKNQNGKYSRKAKTPQSAIPVHISILRCLGLKFFNDNPHHLLNINNLIRRHNPLKRRARTNGFCNRRWIWKRNVGKKRTANSTSAIANKDMMINLIIAQNIPDVFPVFFDTHLLGCLWRVIGTYPETSLYPVRHEHIDES